MADIIIGRMIPQLQGIYKCDVHGQSPDGKPEKHETCNVTLAKEGMISLLLCLYWFDFIKLNLICNFSKDLSLFIN